MIVIVKSYVEFLWSRDCSCPAIQWIQQSPSMLHYYLMLLRTTSRNKNEYLWGMV